MESKTTREDILGHGGTCLADYKVGKAVGKGKFSIVFKAELASTKELCALKKISVYSSMEKKAREKCLKEVRLIKSLDHPNIVQYRDAFVENDELMIAFEWANGGDLKRFIRKAREKDERFDEGLIRSYFSQIAGAIEHMHSRRIMHRDIKPANIFLMGDGRVKVGDLGLGRFLSDDTMEAFSKVGTPLYMAPELLKNNGYDWKSDVWSLGCILYELCQLKSPFKEEGMSLVELFKKISKGSYVPIDGDYSQEIIDLAHSMLLLDPAARPTAMELCDCLEKTNDKRKEVPQRTRKDDEERIKVISTGSPENTALKIMDELVDMLHLLAYDGKVLVTRVHFAIDLEKAGAGPGYHRHRQFSEFMELSSWLLNKCHVQFQYDCMQSPNMNATSLLSALSKAGVSEHFVTSISPPQLISGFGISACYVLKHLGEQALFYHNRFQFREPDYVKLHEQEDAEMNLNPNTQADVLLDNDEVESDLESDAGNFDHEDNEVGPPLVSKRGTDDCQRVLLPMITNPAKEFAEEWHLECEKLKPRLRQIDQNNNSNDHDRGWRLRLNQLSKSETVLSSSFSSRETISRKPSSTLCRQGTLKLQLESLCTSLDKELSKLSRGEERLTTNFANYCDTHLDLQKQSEIVQQQVTELRSRTEELICQLEHVTEQLDDQNEALNERSNTLSNADKPKQLRKAVQRLKHDVGHLDMRIATTLFKIERSYIKT